MFTRREEGDAVGGPEKMGDGRILDQERYTHKK